LIKGTRYQYLSIYAWLACPGMYTSGRLPGYYRTLYAISDRRYLEYLG